MSDTFYPKALCKSAFFIGLVAAVVSTISSPTLQANEIVQVSYVIDGDTVVLEDGRKVRLIGINAPEKKSESRDAEPFSLEASLALQQMTLGKSVLLIKGKQSVDRYGRTLAYIETMDGMDVQSNLIGRGYASYVAISPNVGRIERYRDVEKNTRNKKVGIWSQDNIVTDWHANRSDYRGFVIHQSKIKIIEQSSRAFFLYTDTGIRVRIDFQDQERYWNTQDIDGYLRQKVELRGWVYQRENQLEVRVSHPSMMTILNDETEK